MSAGAGAGGGGDTGDVADRLAALEAHAADQARTIEELDEVVRGQWTRIERLHREIARLEARIEGVERGPEDDRPPPHY